MMSDNNSGSKLMKSGSLSGHGANKSGDGEGPTSSCRSYPKGKGVSTSSPSFNPQRVPATDWLVGGVGG